MKHGQYIEPDKKGTYYYMLSANWAELYRFINKIAGTDASNIIYFLSLITLILGIIGLTGKKDVNSVLRGIVTILITFSITGVHTLLVLAYHPFFR